jgi:hypothetical protein
MTVVAGAEDDRPKSYGVIFTYTDSWAWEFVMYLSTLEIHMYDADIRSHIATGIWEKSPLHGYHGLAASTIPPLLITAP